MSYQRALQLAQADQLDALAIDALHMLAFVDTSPIDHLKWGKMALAIALSSSQPVARQWEASLRNNVGYALHQLKRYDEALDQFRLGGAARACNRCPSHAGCALDGRLDLACTESPGCRTQDPMSALPSTQQQENS